MVNEKRLIDANFLDDRCRHQMADEWNKKVAPVSWSEAYEEFLDDVWDAPTVDAVEVVHGRWIHRPDARICPFCNYRYSYFGGKDLNYCPNCGADMRGKKDA